MVFSSSVTLFSNCSSFFNSSKTDGILLVLAPLLGIDVGAKFEIYSIINQLADEGKGVIVISSEMPELLGICDRIYVMNEGAFLGELAATDASQEKIMSMIVTA
jgi:putative multiple sugar transport system ATP-binding protein